MNLKKAIEIATNNYHFHFNKITEEEKEAVKLLIEAAKRCQYIAEHTDRWAGVLLPGETTE